MASPWLSGISFGTAPTRPNPELAVAVTEALSEMRAIRRLLQAELLTRATASNATGISGEYVSAVGTSGAGTRIFTNRLNHAVAAVVRDRGGTSQALYVSHEGNMTPAEGVLCSGVDGVTASASPLIVLPNQSVYARFSDAANMVDVAVFDPTAFQLEEK